MQVVVVVAQPEPSGFINAIADRSVSALKASAHDVTVIDLHGQGFRAAMSPAERAAYHGDAPVLDPLVQESIDAVKAADALVFVYPTMWSALPAILKGWFERVMVPGVGFVFDDQHRVRPGLRHVRRIVGITTHEPSRLAVAFTNDNGRRVISRALRLSTGLRTRTTWCACYRIGTATASRRAAFLAKVERVVGRL